MPWSEKDYPVSMKNLDSIVKRKAIDIGNAMIKEGYQESDAIPIAISQAKEWAQEASSQEKKDLEKKDITDHENDPENTSARLQDQDVEVKYDNEDESWEVKTKGAQRADSKHATKKEAKSRAEEIAENKDVDVKTYKKSD